MFVLIYTAMLLTLIFLPLSLQTEISIQAYFQDFPASINQENSNSLSNSPIAQGLALEREFIDVTDKSPEFPGGNKAMHLFIRQNIRMPRNFLESGISGKVFVTFIINKKGELSEVSVLKGIGFGCDLEAVRLVESMPRWIPAERDGKPIRIRFNLPISFTKQESAQPK